MSILTCLFNHFYLDANSICKVKVHVSGTQALCLPPEFWLEYHYVGNIKNNGLLSKSRHCRPEILVSSEKSKNNYVCNVHSLPFFTILDFSAR
jgi:hypothetical protein